MHNINKHIIGAVALGAMAIAGQAGAGMIDTFQLDRLHINKCTGGTGPTDCSFNTIYDNHFATAQAGQPSPEVVAATPWGNTSGALFDQAGSRLALGGSRAVDIPVSGVSGNPVVNHQAQLKTPTASGNVLALGRGRPFEVTSIWDWAAPSTDRTRYGMRLTDQGAGGGGAPGTSGNDIVDLTVVNRAGTTYVELRDLLADGTPAGDNVLMQLAIPAPLDSQIALQLAWDQQAGQLLAYYGFTSGGALPGLWTLVDSLTAGGALGSYLFSDDSFTQVRVYASSLPLERVPAPQALLLIGIGLLAMRLQARRRHA